VANNAIKLAGAEIGLGKSEVTHRYAELEKLSDEELLVKMRDEANALLLEHHATEDDSLHPNPSVCSSRLRERRCNQAWREVPEVWACWLFTRGPPRRSGRELTAT
jgi:hypothetical protein